MSSFSNVAEFNRAVQAITKDFTGPQLVALHKKVAFSALRGVVNKTPVDTGRARGNWQASIDIYPSNEIETERHGLGTGAIGKGVEVIKTIRPYCVFFLTNNVSYINVLEFGQFDPPNPGPTKDKRKGRVGKILVKDGFSTQAPNGMVNATVSELRMMFP